MYKDLGSPTLNFPSLAITQYIGAPLYLVKKDYYYRYMAFTKQGMALLVLSMTQWWTSTKVHVSGDESVRDQIRNLPNGRVECNFADRLVLIANHQVPEAFLPIMHTLIVSIKDVQRLGLSLVDRIHW